MKQILENWSYFFITAWFGFRKVKRTFLEHYNDAGHPCFSKNLSLYFVLSEKQQDRYLNELYTMREIAEKKERGDPYEKLYKKFLKGWTMEFPTQDELASLPSH